MKNISMKSCGLAPVLPLALVFAIVVNLAPQGSHAAPPNTVASGIERISEPGEEACSAGKFFLPTKSIVVKSGNGRLLPELRASAAQADARQNLLASTLAYLHDDEAMGKAYADLSITGKRGYSHFKTLYHQGQVTEPILLTQLQAQPQSQGFSPEAMLMAVTQTLDRVFRVAHALHELNSPYRAELGYIAVSGEDDEPHRPVNVPTAPYRQYDLAVPVGTHVVHTRYIIADSLHPETPSAPITPITRWRLPEEPQPTLSADAKVLIYVHGMDSRLEEGLDLTKALQKIARETGENWTVVIMDMPTSGYADKIDHTTISPITDIGSGRGFLLFGFNAHGHQNVPVLDFDENFIVSFVDTLDAKIPLKAHLKAVIGGSLGGNMTFRMGRRTDLAWLKSTVTWSPASIWTGLADGSDLFKQIGVVTGWNRAGGDPASVPETDGARNTFFTQAFRDVINFGPIQVVPAQPNQWWRTTWPCFKANKKLARIEREEIYTPNFRLWHWRLGAEQLIFSQQGAPDISRPRYLDNHVRMLLACGKNDHFAFTDICWTTQKVSRRMVNTPGKTLVFENTGHSIHNERPNAFARQIVKFLNEAPQL